MPVSDHYLAIDLGAASGRAVLGSFDGARLTLRELHRFPNGPVQRPGGLFWDAPRLLAEVKQGLRLAARAGVKLSGIGIDTWGVDYGLLSPGGELLGLPRHYRDPRTRGLMDEAAKVVPRDRIYARTGIQFMEINTLYQLMAEQRAPDNPLARAQTLLFMPDLLNFWLTGRRCSEQTNASTSQLFDTADRAWATDLITELGLPARIFPEVAAPGTTVGILARAVAEETGVGPVPVIAPASHDTGSAVAAVPASGPASDWAYISSGTWSLVGRELAAPLRTPEALAANFTNECGVGNTIRFHKNVAGLWLLQECQRHWAGLDRRYTFDQLRILTLAAPSLSALIDPDHPSFGEFADMPARIREFCARAGGPEPATDGAIARCILESLALRCAAVIDRLEALTGPVRVIHLVGGGSRNDLLCQFTANAAGRPVLAGPVEATAAGNAMGQALALGRVASLGDIRAVIAASFPIVRYDPQDQAAWERARAVQARMV
ncbi:MAG: rhamnulokinase [Phycisphaerales bacterium]|nr:rhamnulokinase [Phycisphaerales bacterium]